MQASGGVQDHHVPAFQPRLGHRGRTDGDGILLPRMEAGHACGLGHHVQLFDGRGAVDVGGHQQGGTAQLLEEHRQFAAGGGLACALKAHHHHHRRRLGGEGDGMFRGLAAHDLHQFVVDDVDEGLGRIEALHDLGTEGLFLHPLEKGPGHAHMDIGLQQGHAHLAQHDFEVGFSDLRLAPEGLHRLAELLGKTVEHGTPEWQNSQCIGRVGLSCRRNGFLGHNLD